MSGSCLINTLANLSHGLLVAGKGICVRQEQTVIHAGQPVHGFLSRKEIMNGFDHTNTILINCSFRLNARPLLSRTCTFTFGERQDGRCGGSNLMELLRIWCARLAVISVVLGRDIGGRCGSLRFIQQSTKMRAEKNKPEGGESNCPCDRIFVDMMRVG